MLPFLPHALRIAYAKHTGYILAVSAKKDSRKLRESFSLTLFFQEIAQHVSEHIPKI
jgi:hypothetical protein